MNERNKLKVKSMWSKITLHFSSSFFPVLARCDWHKQHGDILYIKRNAEPGNFLLRTFKVHTVCEHCQVIGLETLKYLFPRLFFFFTRFKWFGGRRGDFSYKTDIRNAFVNVKPWPHYRQKIRQLHLNGVIHLGRVMTCKLSIASRPFTVLLRPVVLHPVISLLRDLGGKLII